MEKRTPWPIGLNFVSRAQAHRDFQVCAGLDPEGLDQHLAAAWRGECYQLRTGTGVLTYSASPDGPVYWIHAAAGTGNDMTRRGLAAIEYQARQFGCSLVGFQTMRRGLIRQAKALGYLVTDQVGNGFKLHKAIHG